jgi:hypothetical protein
MRKVFELAVVASAIGALAGCGGSDSGPATASVDKTQFHKQVNRLCAKSEEEKFNRIGVAVHELEAHSDAKRASQEDLEGLTTGVVLPVFRDMTEKMRQLTPPSDDTRSFDRVVATFERDIEMTEREPQRFIDGVAFRDGNQVAEAYGLIDCAF